MTLSIRAHKVDRNLVGTTTMEYLSQAHKLELQSFRFKALGIKTLWIYSKFHIRGLGYLLLHILIATIECLETYLGGITKPGAGVGITFAVTIVKLAVFTRLYYLTVDAERYHSWARNCHLALGVLTVSFKVIELAFIAHLVPGSAIVTERYL